MDDLISRQDAIDEAEEWIETYSSGRGGQRERDAIKHVIDGIKKLPVVQPGPKWIPCSERLPENEVDVLCCRDNKTMAIMHFNPVLTARYPKGFSVVKDAFSWRQDNVIAWTTLPEPYKEGEQDD